MRTASLLLLAVILGACRASVRRAPDIAAVVPIFGPVIGLEVIGGRADEGEHVWLLAGGTDLIDVDLGARRSTRLSLTLEAGRECWSLARLSAGSLWTLEGRHSLTEIDRAAHVVRRIALAEPHFGLFAAGDRLLFQQADFVPPGPALRAGRPEDGRMPWSTISTRTFPSLARASVAALNMITCGPTDALERACWFPDEPAVFLTTDDGETRRVELAGLEAVAPETLLTSDNPRRPVRDAYVGGDGSLWILSSGAPPDGQDSPGGWILAHYGAGGAPQGRVRLSEAARLLLRVAPTRVIVLTASGKVAEVRRW
jgi:hypothetical protein